MDTLRRADAKSASTEEEIEGAKCRFRNLEIEDAGIFPYLLSPFTESARTLLSLVSKVSRSSKGERVKGKRAKGGEMGENEGGRDGHMARYRDNRSSKMGGTARVIPVQHRHDVASFERCASNGKTRGCSCVESSPRLQDISESKLLMKRKGGGEREREKRFLLFEEFGPGGPGKQFPFLL